MSRDELLPGADAEILDERNDSSSRARVLLPELGKPQIVTSAILRLVANESR